jgi:hypothetical protein
MIACSYVKEVYSWEMALNIDLNASFRNMYGRMQEN